MPEHPDIEVGARMPDASMNSLDPEWSELVISIGSPTFRGHAPQRRTDHPLTRWAAEELIRCIDAELHPNAGRSISEAVTEDLVRVSRRLAAGTSEEPELDRGRAQGMAWALAVMRNPYDPNMDAIREEVAELLEEAED